VSVGATAYGPVSSQAALHVTPAVDLKITGEPIRILIVEDLRAVADALEAVLSRQPGMVVVGNLGSVTDSDPRALELEADIVILEFRLTDEFAANALRTIWLAGSTAKVIFLTSEEGDRVILAAIDAGASAVLFLSSATVDLVQTIRTVADGGSPISAGTIATLLNGRRKSDGLRDKLTRREMEILNLMAVGTSNREIAAGLGISYVTVRCHVRNLSSKLAAHSQLEAVVRAQKLDLVDRRAAIRSSYS
jgi:DNA-binding NarL/FixJ family response regulator